MGSIEPPFYAANRLTISRPIQSQCVAITARVEAISLNGLDFWLELINCLWCVAWTMYKEGEKAQAYTNPVINIAIQTPLKTVYHVIV